MARPRHHLFGSGMGASELAPESWTGSYPRFEVWRFSRTGFEWTYEGDGPRQLALALLCDCLGDARRALELTEPFMRSVVAELDNSWRLTSEEIDAAIRDID